MLARALGAVEVVPLDEPLAKRAGLLLARSRTADIVDAAVVALSRAGDRIVTSDPDDIDALIVAGDVLVDIVPV